MKKVEPFASQIASQIVNQKTVSSKDYWNSFKLRYDFREGRVLSNSALFKVLLKSIL